MPSNQVYMISIAKWSIIQAIIDRLFKLSVGKTVQLTAVKVTDCLDNNRFAIETFLSKTHCTYLAQIQTLYQLKNLGKDLVTFLAPNSNMGIIHLMKNKVSMINLCRIFVLFAEWRRTVRNLQRSLQKNRSEMWHYRQDIGG